MRRLLLCCCLWLVGCTVSPDVPLADSPALRQDADSAEETALILPEGRRATVLVEGLLGPTQMIAGPDERLWIAQLAGRENAASGQVVAIDLTTGARETLLTNLDKPTGIAVLDGALWIATRRALLRAPLDDARRPAAPETVLADLPYNGRSNGTLTVTPAGELLYETSGARAGDEALAGSATLWRLDPADPAKPQALATGLKGAYAHAFDRAGRLWTTEIGDDLVNGQAPPDELNWVLPGADFGWPQCFGRQEAAENYGGTAARCAESRAPAALFPPRSTPTSVVASPWEEDVLLVALWLEGRVVRVPVGFERETQNATGVVEPFIDGLTNPQHLLITEDGALFVSDFATGTIYRIE